MASRTEDLFRQATALSGAQAPQDRPPAGLPMPPMMYGTAWKKERTAELVYQAIKAGFRGIDTAAMGKHYREDLVGEGIRKAVAEGIVKRQDLYIQTKFTPTENPQEALASQVPYDPNAPLATQIDESIASSLRNLATIPGDDSEPYIDSLVLHSPLFSADKTRAAWTALSRLAPHPVRAVGISNIDAALLRELWPGDESSTLPLPAVVQNRFCERESVWHHEVRSFCRERGVTYQGFWILTANPELWAGRHGNGPAAFVERLAQGAGVDCATALYALVLALGVVVLDGTTKAERMVGHLEGVEKVAAWSQSKEGKERFSSCLADFEEWISPGTTGY